MDFPANSDLSIYKGEIYSSRESVSRRSPQNGPKKSPLSLDRQELPDSTEEDVSQKTRLVITAALYLLFFTLGMNSASIGTTLVHMAYIFEANIQVMNFTVKNT